MATTVYDEVEIELQDGTPVILRPLNISKLKKFMLVMKELNAEQEIDSDEESDAFANLDVLLSACKVALEDQLRDKLNKNPDILEEILDVPTMWKIVEISGGVQMSDPNLLVEAARESVGQTSI